MASENPQLQKLERSNSISHASENSQTAQDFINSQLQLEADAREALPYQFDTCTRDLGPLRQSLFSCLTCNPPPKNADDSYTPAGVCYSCSISCHGEHELVELFNKRNFVCDCGTTRFGNSQPCTLRINDQGTKGNVHSQQPAAGNKYNQNFHNRFCTCATEYDPHSEKGTMFQCLGLGTIDDGGCGEDWYHPECLLGLPRDWKDKLEQDATSTNVAAPAVDTPAITAPAVAEPTDVDIIIKGGVSEALSNGDGTVALTTTEAPTLPTEDAAEEPEDDLPPGFPKEDDFDNLICFKCVEAFPWIKRHANAKGFLNPIFYRKDSALDQLRKEQSTFKFPAVNEETSKMGNGDVFDSKKRKASPVGDLEVPDQAPKRQKSVLEDAPPLETVQGKAQNDQSKSFCLYEKLPSAPEGVLSLCTSDDFRDYLCRCPSCFPRLAKHPWLLEDEETYEPPMSIDGDEHGSLGSKSLLDRGEAALSNVDRVRAIEGVMVYNHLKDKVKDFLKPFAERGEAVGAEDIKKYFEGLRGDAEAIKAAGLKNDQGSGGGDDNRKEQSGY